MKLSKAAILANLAGLIVPLLIGLLTIPALLSRLGNERFGLLSLAWSLTAVAGLFDLGVGRAATLVISRHLGLNEQAAAAAAAESSSRLAFISGLVGAAVFAASVALGLPQRLSYSPEVAAEVVGSAWLLTLAIPLQVGIAAHRGICEAHQRFHRISVIRIAMGIANFGGPWLASLFTHDLRIHVCTLVAARAASWSLFRNAAHSAVGPLHDKRDRRHSYSELLRAGGWFTVSAVVSPILVQVDRFVIGAVLSSESVPTYSVPADLILQSLVLATATSTVVFPNMASLIATSPEAAWHGLLRLLGIVAAQMAIVSCVTAALVPYVLPWWVNHKLPNESVPVAQILCIGVWINALGMMCMTFLHAHHQYRSTALAHLAELVVYVPLLALLLKALGIPGAAWAWTARVGIDTACLLIMSMLVANASRAGSKPIHTARPAEPAA